MARKPEQFDGHPVADMILAGNYDEDMQIIRDALNARTRHLEQRKKEQLRRTLNPGDAVRVVGRIKPKYLIGCAGIVESVDDRFAHVRWFARDSHRVGRYGGSGNAIGVPLNCIERIAMPRGTAANVIARPKPGELGRPFDGEPFSLNGPTRLAPRLKRPDELGKPRRTDRKGAKR